MKTILFEAIVSDSYVSNTTDPPSQVISLQYDLPPIDIVDIRYDPFTEACVEEIVGQNDFGITQLCIPHKVDIKPGDKIQIVKDE